MTIRSSSKVFVVIVVLVGLILSACGSAAKSVSGAFAGKVDGAVSGGGKLSTAPKLNTTTRVANGANWIDPDPTPWIDPEPQP